MRVSVSASTSVDESKNESEPLRENGSTLPYSYRILQCMRSMINALDVPAAEL